MHGKTGSHQKDEVCPKCPRPGPEPGVAQTGQRAGEAKRPQTVPSHDGRAGFVGKIGQELGQLSAGSGPIRKPRALAELIRAEPALDVVLGELDDHLLTVGVGCAHLVAAGPRGPAAVPVWCGGL